MPRPSSQISDSNALIRGQQTLFTSSHRFTFNGKESDSEVKGEGNSLDFGARVYDSRICSVLSLDPLSKLFPSESNYSYAGNSPISLLDDLGKKKTYYITKIAKDGTKTTIAIVDKYKVKTVTNYTQSSVRIGGKIILVGTNVETKTYDLVQHVVIDEKTGNVLIGEEEESTERSNVAFFRGIEDNVESMSALLNDYDSNLNGGGGIVFVSTAGQSQEERSGYNADPEAEKIDMLLAVIDVANTASSTKPIKDFLSGVKKVVEVFSVSSVLKENLVKSNNSAVEHDSTYCGTCDKNVSNSDTINHIIQPK